MCGPVEPDTLEFHVDADLNLVFDSNDQPHISYKFLQTDIDTQSIFGLKYAKGTFVGVEEYKGGKTKKTPELKLFPNPCSGLLNIEYSMQEAGEAEISIYDVTGRVVREIANEYFSTGHHNRTFDARGLPPGVYFIRLDAGNHSEIKKVIFIK